MKDSSIKYSVGTTIKRQIEENNTYKGVNNVVSFQAPWLSEGRKRKIDEESYPASKRQH